METPLAFVFWYERGMDAMHFGHKKNPSARHPRHVGGKKRSRRFWKKESIGRSKKMLVLALVIQNMLSSINW